MSTPTQADSLVDLAARKQLPHHQFTDRTTVEWIKANRPQLPGGPPPRLPERSRGLLARSGIPRNWLAEPRLFDSLHGVRHAIRTAALAALLAETTGLNEDDTATLVLAAAVHDCRRRHDKDDPGHGARAAAWITANVSTVWGRFELRATPESVVQAVVATRLHDVPYSAFSAEDQADHARTRHITDLLKAADALDRYRLPRLDWWPDNSHVRVDAFEELRATAFSLVVQSETAHLAGAHSADAVFEALASHGVVC